MRPGFFLAYGRPSIDAAPPTVVLPITVVDSKTSGGATPTNLVGLLPDDDVLVIIRKTGSTSAPTLPSGNPLGYTTRLTAIGADTAARAFHVKVTAGMLTGGSFAAGTFGNASTGGRNYAVALRNVVSVGPAATATTGALTDQRPFATLGDLGEYGLVVGLSHLSSGTPPVPSGATILQDAVGRLWTGVPTGPTWNPAPASAGSVVDWVDMAIGFRGGLVAAASSDGSIDILLALGVLT